MGDFNRDNKIDLAVANGSNVAILLGNGDGTFAAFHNFPAGGASTSISQASFEVLGTEDIVVGGGQSFFILPGNGDGTFQAPVLFWAALTRVCRLLRATSTGTVRLTWRSMDLDPWGRQSSLIRAVYK